MSMSKSRKIARRSGGEEQQQQTSQHGAIRFKDVMLLLARHGRLLRAMSLWRNLSWSVDILAFEAKRMCVYPTRDWREALLRLVVAGIDDGLGPADGDIYRSLAQRIHQWGVGKEGASLSRKVKIERHAIYTRTCLLWWPRGSEYSICYFLYIFFVRSP
jgi:hypothetical protein